VSNSVFRRCGCRGQDGKQLGASCPQLKSDPKHGSWAYHLSHGSDPRTGQRRQHRKAGFKTKRAAESALAKLRASLDSGTHVEPTKITLADYARQWLARRQVTGTGLKATTLSGYRRYIENDITLSTLGGMRLSDIRRAHINQFTAGLTTAGRGAVTVRRTTTLLGTIFASEQKDELAIANPVSGADRPMLTGATVKVWEPEHVRQFLQRSARHRLGPLFEVAVLTGLRRGELCGLRWAEDGRPLDPSYVTRLFSTLRREGEPLPSLSFHGLRHCAASLMLASAADIAVVSKLLGHASIAITSDVYGHLVGTIAQKAVDGAANLIAHAVHTQQGVDA
jgi:integrase